MSGFSLQVNRPFFVLYQLIGADMNTTADQPFVRMHNFSAYSLQFFRAMNASINLTTVAGGVYTGAAKSGLTLVAASQVYTSLTSPSKGQALTLATGGDPVGRVTADPILSLSTPQGAPATCDIYVLGFGVI
jgi:hypothetical protein